MGFRKQNQLNFRYRYVVFKQWLCRKPCALNETNLIWVAVFSNLAAVAGTRNSLWNHLPGIYWPDIVDSL
jgi:hypothetical protein